MSLLQVPVATKDELESTMTSYVAQGFTVQLQTDTSITMIKKKELNMVWLIVGILLCFIPLIIELIRYSRAEDQVVVIKLQASPEVKLEAPGGEARIPSQTNAPPVVSEDGKSYWDGQKWQPIAKAEGER
jgi:hypothetical protein